MNKLKGDCFIGHDTSIFLYKYSCMYKYRSCSGKLFFDLSHLQERIFVYTLINCTIKLTYALMDSSFWSGAINLGWSIVYTEGSQDIIST